MIKDSPNTRLTMANFAFSRQFRQSKDALDSLRACLARQESVDADDWSEINIPLKIMRNNHDDGGC
jgi:hypothetical protein